MLSTIPSWHLTVTRRDRHSAGSELTSSLRDHSGVEAFFVQVLEAKVNTAVSAGVSRGAFGGTIWMEAFFVRILGAKVNSVLPSFFLVVRL